MRALRRTLAENWLTILVVGVLVGAFALLRSNATDIATIEEYEALIQNGQGSIVYFYSNT